MVVMEIKADNLKPPSDVYKVAVPSEPSQIQRECPLLSVELWLVPVKRQRDVLIDSS